MGAFLLHLSAYGGTFPPFGDLLLLFSPCWGDFATFFTMVTTACITYLISVKNCDLDLKRQKRRFYANTNMLLRKFVKCSPDVKCYLFKTYCCNLYCAPFWYDSTKTAMKNLKVAYNNSLRRLLGLPSHNSASGMFVNLNIPSFGELLRKYVYNFRNRLETSDNVIIRRIYLSHITFQSGIWDWWRDILSP